MKIKDLKNLNEKDLNEKLVELRKEIMKLNAQVTTGTTPKSPGQIKKTKKTIARILTVLKNKPESKKA